MSSNFYRIMSYLSPRSQWQNLPDVLFSDIMMIVGLESLDDLHRCRQVCRNWNEKIKQNIWDNRQKRFKLDEKLKKCWKEGTPKYSKSSKSYKSSVKIEAAVGDYLALWDTHSSSLKIYHKFTNRWKLPCSSNHICRMTDRILALVFLETGPDSKEETLQVYELETHKK